MDLLSDIFKHLRPSGAMYFRADLKGGWAIAVPDETETIRFHLVLQGECYARLSKDHDPHFLEEGDLLIVSAGRQHFLADRPGHRPVPLDEILKNNPPDSDGQLRVSGEGSHRVRLLCGFCAFDQTLDHPLLRGLPDMLVLKRPFSGYPPQIGQILNIMAVEADMNAPGMIGVLTRLMEIIVIQIVRAQAEVALNHPSGFFAAVADPKLGAALTRIHNAPEQKWTLTLLAREAGMSRTVFAQRFSSARGGAADGLCHPLALAERHAICCAIRTSAWKTYRRPAVI